MMVLMAFICINGMGNGPDGHLKSIHALSYYDKMNQINSSSYFGHISLFPLF